MPKTKQQAQQEVDVHVSPRECFVEYENNAQGWRAIPGTGCAHWVAHQRGIQKKGDGHCDTGYAIRVKDVVAGMSAHAIKDAKVGDIWTKDDHSHTGLVTEVHKDGKVKVKHCSSAQGGVVESVMGSGHAYR